MPPSTAKLQAMHAPEDPVLGTARVAVVIPCYKVERQVERVVRGIPDWVGHVIAVVDASPDGTRAKLDALRAGGEARLTVIEHEVNQGVGGAMQTGFQEALRLGVDVVVKMDGDDQMNPADLPHMVAPLLDGRADVTKGNRYGSRSSVQQMPLVRIAGNAGLTFLVKAASGYWNIFDPANGYVALRREVLERLKIARLPKRYFFESGLIIELGILRAVVRDVPIQAKYGDEESNLSVGRTLVGFPPRLVMGLLRRVFWRHFVHDFSAVSLFLLFGLPLFAGGLAYGAWVWWELNRLSLASDVPAYATAGQVMLAAMPMILGFQMLLQAVVLDIAAVPREPLSGPALEQRERPAP